MDFSNMEKSIQSYLQNNTNEVLSQLLSLLKEVRNIDPTEKVGRVINFVSNAQKDAFSDTEKLAEYMEASKIFGPYLGLGGDDDNDEQPASATTQQPQTSMSIKAKINAGSSIPAKNLHYGSAENFLAKNIAAIIFTLLFVSCVFAGGMYINGDIVIDDGGFSFVARVIEEDAKENLEPQDIFLVSMSGSRGIDIYGNLWNLRGTGDTDPTPEIIMEGTSFVSVVGSHAIDVNGSLWALRGLRDTDSTLEIIMEGISFASLFSSYAIDTNGNLWVLNADNGLRFHLGMDDSEVPFIVMEGTAFGNVFSFGSYTWAIDIEGNLWAWGVNREGQLGDGTTDNSSAPLHIIEGITFQKVSSARAYWAGGRYSDIHTIAVDTEGNLWGWGDNSSGQLGDGTTQNRALPAKIEAEATFLYVHTGRLAAGGSSAGFAMALDVDGIIWAWGAYRGGAGDNITMPRRVTGDDTAFISISRWFALDADGLPWEIIRNDADTDGYAFREIDASTTFVNLIGSTLTCTDGLMWQIDWDSDAIRYIVRRPGR